MLTDAWKGVKSNRNSQHTVFIRKLDIDDSTAIRTGWFPYGIKHELAKCNVKSLSCIIFFFPLQWKTLLKCLWPILNVNY